jgi:hypothetical protein
VTYAIYHVQSTVHLPTHQHPTATDTTALVIHAKQVTTTPHVNVHAHQNVNHHAILITAVTSVKTVTTVNGVIQRVLSIVWGINAIRTTGVVMHVKRDTLITRVNVNVKDV